MRIAVNALASPSGGGYTYLLQLVRHLLAGGQDESFILFCQRSWADPLPGDRVRFVEAGALSLPGRFFYEQTVLPVQLRRLGADLLYSPAEVACFGAGCPQVLGIQNPNPYEPRAVIWPARERLRLKALRMLASLSARAADHIVFVSDTARERTMKSLGDPPTPWSVVHHGVDLNRFHPSDGPAQRKGILCVADVERHKNLETLIRGYALLPAPVRREHGLKIVGHLNDPGYHRYLEGMAGELDLGEGVRFAGGVPFARIPEFYREAAVFVLPSLLETFGLPLLEAMACGTPVVAASSSCLPEVCGEAALFFSPRDPAELAAQVGLLLGEGRLAGEMRRLGLERCRSFAWESAAVRMSAIFRQVGGA